MIAGWDGKSTPEVLPLMFKAFVAVMRANDVDNL